MGETLMKFLYQCFKLGWKFVERDTHSERPLKIRTSENDGMRYLCKLDSFLTMPNTMYIQKVSSHFKHLQESL